MATAHAASPDHLFALDLRAVLRSARTRVLRNRTDRAIVDGLIDAFERDPGCRVQGLTFQVYDGVVTVFGRTLSTSERSLIVARASAIPNVRDVVDRLLLAAAA